MRPRRHVRTRQWWCRRSAAGLADPTDIDKFYATPGAMMYSSTGSVVGLQGSSTGPWGGRRIGLRRFLGPRR